MTTLYKIRLRKGIKRDSNEIIGKIRAGQVRAVTKEQRDAIMGTTNSSPRHLAKWYEDCGTMEISDEPEQKPEPAVDDVPVEEFVAEVVEPEDVPEEIEEEPAEDIEVEEFDPEPEPEPKAKKSRKAKRINKKSTK